MSKVAIKGNASGTGTFTLEAPNSNTDRTLVLPDEAGTVITTGGTGSVTADMLSSTLDLSGKTVTLPGKYATVQETAVTGITSTASVEYTGIPDYVTKLTVLLNEVSQGSIDQVGIFVGDATTGGYPTGVYQYQDTYVTHNAATSSEQRLNANFIAINGFTATANQFNWVLNFVSLGHNNIWQFDLVGNTFGFSPYQLFVSGYVQLAGQLDRVKVAPDSGVLDAGNINILYS